LDHTLLENTHSPSPFDVPTPVTDAIRSPAVRSAIDGCVPFLLFLARLVAHMEGDATPLSSYVAIFACLRAPLANHFTGPSVAARQAMQSSLERRYTSFSDPLVALAFWLDPFWAPVRARLSCLLWGTKSLATLRDEAVVFLCRPDNAARALVLAELASFADTEQGPAALEQSSDLHPVMWWRLWGWRFPTLRLLSIPPSAARGERIFKALKTVLSTRRSRLAPERVDNQTRLRFKTRQLERADVLAAFRRPTVEFELRVLLAGETGAGAPAAAPPAAAEPDSDGDGGGSSGDDVSDDEGGDTGGGHPSDDATVDHLLGTAGVDAAVDFLLS